MFKKRNGFENFRRRDFDHATQFYFSEGKSQLNLPLVVHLNVINSELSYFYKCEKIGRSPNK